MSQDILLIEDDAMVALSIRKALMAAGFDVTVTHNGPDGIHQARRMPPAMIVLDVVMPGMDGFDVCREIRADARIGETPVMFLTGRDSDADRIAGFRAGADDYLTKPFNLQELELRVRAILRRTGSVPELVETPDKLVVTDLELDCRTFKVRAPVGEVLLTNVQYDLLYYLMTHAGRVFSTQQLLQAVWNYPPNSGSPELVRAHIRNLREKIERQPSQPKILVTVQGHGYTIRR